MKTNKPQIPRLIHWLLCLIANAHDRDSIIHAYMDIYELRKEEKGSFSALLLLWGELILSAPGLIISKIVWSLTMLKNFVKIAYRNYFRNKLFSFINIFGLALGLGACMLITLWVQRELSYEDFHTNADRIFRIERELLRDEAYSRWPIVSGAYKERLVAEYPDIESGVRVWRRAMPMRDENNNVYRQQMYAVDNSIFEVFNFELISGDENSALTEPRALVMTSEAAKKYFGSDDVIGKTIKGELGAEFVDFTVTGILKDVPGNSHIQFEMLISINTYPDERFNDWRSNYLYTYILAGEKVDSAELEEKLKSFVELHLAPVYGDLLAQGLPIHEVLQMHLFPIKDIHLNPSPNYAISPGGNKSAVYIFISISILILLLACMNFVNLSTARAKKRAKEVGLRKAIGASVKQIKWQFLFESVMLTMISLPIAVALLSLFIPAFNEVFAETLTIGMFLFSANTIYFALITFALGLLSGIYPAIYMTRFSPVEVLKGSMSSSSGKALFRKNMVTIQFSISVVLIIGMMMSYKQMQFIQNRDLGFEENNLIVLRSNSQTISDNINTFKNKLKTNSKVISSAFSTDIPSAEFMSNSNFESKESTEDRKLLNWFTTGYDFVDTYELELAAGRNFSRDFSADTNGTLILNETAVRAYGWSPEEAVGKDMSYMGNFSGKIVGVVKDFNYRSLRNEIEPLAMLFWDNSVRYTAVRIQPGDISGTIASIENSWQETFPGEEFDYSFLDSRLDMLYKNEKRLENIFIAFGAFSILVACMGLFGLTAFTVEERTKEIGIRKVLGASSRSIVYLVAKEFSICVLISNLIAWPVGYYLITRWLEDFAYKADIGIGVFVLAAVISVFIATFTVSTQTIKLASKNPVDSIRYE